METNTAENTGEKAEKMRGMVDIRKEVIILDKYWHNETIKRKEYWHQGPNIVNQVTVLSIYFLISLSKGSANRKYLGCSRKYLSVGDQ